MHCEQAKTLIDAYLDGDLAPTLANELSAHCMQCPDCRQMLALSEVAGHLVSADSDSVALDDEFTDRLMACIELPGNSRKARLWRITRIGVPFAAAAVLVFALFGAFDPAKRVAGEKEFAPPVEATSIQPEPSAVPDAATADDPSSVNVPPAPPVRWQSLPQAIELLLSAPSGEARPTTTTPSSAIEAGVEDL
jgi:anti-sigma factor RsiW